ncbi:MAG: hypothetical protein AB7F86_15505 [Bdellovibrionales bacterium]
MNLFVLLQALTAIAFAQYQPRRHQIVCHDDKAVAKEAIDYALLGAFEPYANHKCFLGKKVFRFFRPDLAFPEGELIDPKQVTVFQPGRDRYKINTVSRTKDGKEVKIEVEFRIKGKTLSTTYDYVPDEEYTGRTGICGFVTNPRHKIIRKDCIDSVKGRAILKLPN